jgi:DNA-directed RNA polymerase subunit RPC12/RpoP
MFVNYKCTGCGKHFAMSANEWLWHRLCECTGRKHK